MSFSSGPVSRAPVPNKFPTPIKPLPPAPAGKGALKISETRAVPIKVQTSQEQQNLERLMKEQVQLLATIDVCKDYMKGLDAKKQSLAAEKQSLAAEKKSLDAKERSLDAKENEIFRNAVAQFLDLVFDLEDYFPRRLSLAEARKFEFDPEAQIFNIPESAMKDVVLKYLKADKQFSKLDLTICTRPISERVVVNLLKKAPKTGLQQVRMPRELTPNEKKTYTAAQKSLKALKVEVESAGA